MLSINSAVSVYLVFAFLFANIVHFLCNWHIYLLSLFYATEMASLNETSKFRELWSPARQQMWPWSRSKVTVKVTTWYHWKGLVTKNTHAKYQSSICYSAKVMAKVKVFVTEGLTDRRTDWLTDEWDLMSPAFAKAGDKNILQNMCIR